MRAIPQNVVVFNDDVLMFTDRLDDLVSKSVQDVIEVLPDIKNDLDMNFTEGKLTQVLKDAKAYPFFPKTEKVINAMHTFKKSISTYEVGNETLAGLQEVAYRLLYAYISFLENLQDFYYED